MPFLRFTLSSEDYCQFQQALHSGRKIEPTREKIEVHVPVDDAEYRYYRRQQRRLRRLGQPSTMSYIMARLLHRRIVADVMSPDWEERLAKYKESR